jgi:nitrite reductase/ring-hydroxylating ferredoxin subunit
MLWVVMIFMPLSCDNNKDELIPYVAVDFTIDILSTFYTELTSVGGYVYVTGGYKGIIIYRLSMDEFLAYDRSCSFQPRDPCEKVHMEPSGLTMIDSCCTSRFLILDGSPIEGPATRMLRQYRTMFDGRFLRVFN